MSDSNQRHLEARVLQAAETVLQRDGNVGPLQLFLELEWLQPVHVAAWKHGDPAYQILEEHIQVGRTKREAAARRFSQWAAEKGLRPVEASHQRQGPHGLATLQVTRDREPEDERFYRTHYAPSDLSARKAAGLERRLRKAPELVVFQTVREEVRCGECEASILHGDHLVMESDQPVCLTCADLDHLVFLPSGDAALSRRARKHSPLAAVVVRFNRSRKRYERQGLLVTQEAIDQAEAQCAADAPERAAARTQAAVRRQGADVEFVNAFARSVTERFPACPPGEAMQIAQHTGRRSSGRVGRSAAGRALDARAIDLAVIAHVRHEHTDYDRLLMQGMDRHEARARVGETIDQVLANWSRGNDG